jgi:beta-1,4-mannosyl-glycoprotein beta-1,4-N-acetylglucosaminyltransferase
MKIYDGFLFFNELELLELRLNTLNNVVDYFILVEASVTHQGTPKPFIFEENKERFSKFLNKIIHIKITEIPSSFSTLPNITPTNFKEEIIKGIYDDISKTRLFNRFVSHEMGFGRDFFQKESIKLGMENASDDDIFISSDLDEIPNPEIISRLNEFFEPDAFYTFNQTHYCYYLNMMHFSHIDNTAYNQEINSNWKGSRMGTWKNMKHYSLNELRAQDNNDIIDSGWHFSWMGGIDKVKTKLQSYSHQENNQSHIIDNVDKMMNVDDTIYDFRGDKSIKVPITLDTHPEYLVNNIDKYKHLIK